LEAKQHAYRVQVRGTPEEVCKLVLWTALETKAQVRGFRVAERSLEDAFLEAIHG
jgi:hypothetical protein